MKRRSPTTETSPRPRLSSLSRRRFCGPALIALVVLTLLSPGLVPGLSSQSKNEKPYALIFGTVWGPDSQPAYGIRIKIRRERDKKAKWELSSDHRGEFAQRVPAGKEDYIVSADLKGVTSGGKPLHADEVKVHIDNDERADIGVHLTE
jgi:hypothetical protein